MHREFPCPSCTNDDKVDIHHDLVFGEFKTNLNHLILYFTINTCLEYYTFTWRWGDSLDLT